ncbi:AraC family transcriptional regulator [Mesorhizobium loti]|nr:helix-turn-helix domain-containing protein [Mesorhizobium loti]PLP56376.1 AraC family transcriptional regulator [Mesorhizobium loti]
MSDRSDQPVRLNVAPDPVGASRVERRRWPREPDSTNDAASTPPALTPLRFSTASFEPAEQFTIWRSHLEPIVEVGLPDGVTPQDGFTAEHTAWNLGKMLLVQQRTAAYRYTRSAEKLRSSSIDHWYIGIPHKGHAWTEVDGHVVESRRDTVTFRSLGHPYRGRATESEVTLLYMPYNLFAGHAGMLVAANNSVFSGNYATLLIDYICSVEKRLPTLVADDLAKIAHTIRDMLITCLTEAAANNQNGVNQSTLSAMERVHHYIHSNLGAPNLNPESISRAMGISRTRLYQLFETSGGVLNYIRKQRLQDAYAALSDPTNNQRILDIAEEAGFDVAANFTRAFIHEFRLSPSEVRKAATGQLPTAVRADQSPTPTFEKWLRELGH